MWLCVDCILSLLPQLELNRESDSPNQSVQVELGSGRIPHDPNRTKPNREEHYSWRINRVGGRERERIVDSNPPDFTPYLLLLPRPGSSKFVRKWRILLGGDLRSDFISKAVLFHLKGCSDAIMAAEDAKIQSYASSIRPYHSANKQALNNFHRLFSMEINMAIAILILGKQSVPSKYHGTECCQYSLMEPEFGCQPATRAGNSKIHTHTAYICYAWDMV